MYTSTSINSFLSGSLLLVMSLDVPRSTSVGAGAGRGCATPAATAAPTMVADFVVSANADQQWIIDGVVNPTLTLTRGQPYTFDLTSFTDEHPFIINGNVNNPFGIQYAGPAYGSVLTFTPTNAMPATIYYHCTVHYGSMAGAIILGPAPGCFGDLDQDQAVNVTDFGHFVGAYGTSCSACPADLNNDGSVNVLDFGLFVSAFGSSCN